MILTGQSHRLCSVLTMTVAWAPRAAPRSVAAGVVSRGAQLPATARTSMPADSSTAQDSSCNLEEGEGEGGEEREEGGEERGREGEENGMQGRSVYVL